MTNPMSPLFFVILVFVPVHSGFQLVSEVVKDVEVAVGLDREYVLSIKY